MHPKVVLINTNFNCNVFHLLLTQFFNVGSVALGGAYFGSGNGNILLDNVVCSGTESSLLECRTNPIGLHNCNNSEDAGVRCEGEQVHFANTLR